MESQIKKQFDLTEKVAIVTGASKGIGESIARGLAEFGAKVVVSSRNQDAVDEVANKFKEDGLEASGIACHVGNDEQLKNLVNKTVNLYGGIDIIVNNAATNPHFGTLETCDNALFDKMMQINVRAPFNLANMVYPIMKERGGGSIINISSVEGLKPSGGLGLYSMNKAALIMLTKSQANEWGKDGVRANAICPGLIQTKFSTGLWKNEKVMKRITGELPARRMAQPDEMSGLACFLASDASSYCTGSVYVADGGHMITGGLI